MHYEHYKHFTEPKPDGPQETLEGIKASGRANEAERHAQQAKQSRFRHKARMEQFRAWVYKQDYLTDEDRAGMIKASFGW